MALSNLPLSYCTNVHPGRSLVEVELGLDRYTAAVRENYGAPLAAGLWLAARVVRELVADRQTLNSFREGLSRRAIEPEPLCLIETTDEAIGFFKALWEQAAGSGLLEAARRHLGLCYDVCHQAVEFEDIPASIRRLTAAGVRINKVHITCA